MVPRNFITSKSRLFFALTNRKPFIGTDQYDINLFPENEYNITSAYGCYVKQDATTPGYDGDTLKAADYDTNPVGCKSHWQAING